MKKIIVLTEEEWNDLPIDISKQLYLAAIKKNGFKLISKQTKKEIKDKLLNYIIGNIKVIFNKIEINYLHNEDYL